MQKQLQNKKDERTAGSVKKSLLKGDFMIINHNSVGESYLPFFSIEGIEKNRRNEKIITNFITTLYDFKMYNSLTLNKWKGNTLEIRYSRNLDEFKTLLNARKTDKNLSESHSERSLLY